MRWVVLLGILLASVPARALEIDWVEIDDPGNAADPVTGSGSVAYVYSISRFEITNAEYAEFLNAVAKADPDPVDAGDFTPLYNAAMGTHPLGGIVRTGTLGDYVYTPKAGAEDKPVNLVSWWDALRFANWLHNGQPMGGRDATTTEDGAYTIDSLDQTAHGTLPPDPPGPTLNRNPGATVFLPNEDEWFKAAYYDPVSATYFEYPAGSDAATTCAQPSATPNTANCAKAVGSLTVVGAYSASASPYGTFDQGGNLWEWNETWKPRIEDGRMEPPDGRRGLRGGNYNQDVVLLSTVASEPCPTTPTVPPCLPNSHGPDFEIPANGFRVAYRVPEPRSAVLGVATALGLGLWRRSARRAAGVQP